MLFTTISLTWNNREILFTLNRNMASTKIFENCLSNTLRLSLVLECLYIYIYLWWWCSVAKSYLTLCDPMDCSMPGFPVLHYLLGFALTHVHWVGDAIQPSHALLYLSPTFNLSQHQCLFQWVCSLHQVTKVLKLQLQHPSSEYSGLTSFRIDWFDILAVQGTLKSLL